MKSILIQNIFNNHEKNYYLFSCKPYGIISVGDFINLNENFNVKIEDIEKVFYDIIISVKKESFSSDYNLSQLYNKEYNILSVTPTNQ